MLDFIFNVTRTCSAYERLESNRSFREKKMHSAPSVIVRKIFMDRFE